MTNYKYTLVYLFVFSLLVSCGKTENKKDDSSKIEQKKIGKTFENNGIEQQTDTVYKATNDSINEIKSSVFGNQNYKRKKESLVLSNDTTQIIPINSNVDKTSPIVNPTKKTTKPSFVYIKKILNECDLGISMTQEDLEKKFKIPKEAIKLVKSVTKTAPNELDIKWKSTWMVEKISDAKFKDGKLKMRFEDNKMYASGGAISIKYEKKLYADLVLVGHTARIPSVKGYYWQIGKDK